MLKGVVSEEMIDDAIWRFFTVVIPSTDFDHFSMMCDTVNRSDITDMRVGSLVIDGRRYKLVKGD